VRQTDARPSAIGKVFTENPRLGSRTRDSDVPPFFLFLSVTDFVGMCAIKERTGKTRIFATDAK